MTALQCIAAALAALWGLAGAPAAASRLLRAKRARLERYWSDRFDEYAARLAEDPSFSADARSVGAEGALGIWRDDMLRSWRNGTLSSDKAAALAGAGIVGAPDIPSAGAEGLRGEDEIARAFSARPSRTQRALWAASLAASAAALFALAPPAAASAALAALGLLVLTAMTDSAARIIPYECAWALYPVALGYSLARGGPGCALACALAGLCALAVLRPASGLLALAGLPDSVGAGDMRLLPACVALCGADGAPWFLLALAAASLLDVGRRLACGAVGMGSRVPMGGYIAIASMAGVLAPLVANG